MSKTNKITLRGSHEGKKVTFDPSLHVELSDGFYLKNDHEEVVCIKNRYFRRSSPLVKVLSHDFYGEEIWELTELCVETYRGDWLKRVDAISVNLFEKAPIDPEIGLGIKIREVICARYVSMTSIRDSKGRILRGIFDGRLNQTDLDEMNIVHNPNSDVSLASKDCFIELSSAYSGSNRFFSIVSSRQTREENIENYLYLHEGEYYRKEDMVFSRNLEGKQGVPVNITIRRPRQNGGTLVIKIRDLDTFKCLDNIGVRAIFSDRAADQLSDEQLRNIYGNLLSNSNISDVDSEYKSQTERCKFGFRVSKQHVERVNAIFNAMSVSNIVEKGRSYISNIPGSSWLGHDILGLPDVYMSGYEQDTGGDYVHYKAHPEEPRSNISPTSRTTGGVNYTFGVELETSYGHLPLNTLSHLNIDCVGDRSIGSLEYVTPPLHGDKGMNRLAEICDALSKFCAVDDRCGVHVHVGGSKYADSPAFNRRFSILSIMLGTQIERELFSLMPPNRMEGRTRDGIPYCGSILEFSDTSFVNGRNKLARYVFNSDQLSSDRNVRTGLGRWTQSRYKWLNLVNCNTDNSGRRGGGFKTIEFRAFNGSLKYYDIRAFVLLSLAFTSFVENRSRRIKEGGVTLSEMVSVLNKPSMEFMLQWMETKKSEIASRREELSSRVTSPLPAASVAETIARLRTTVNPVHAIFNADPDEDHDDDDDFWGSSDDEEEEEEGSF